MDFFCCLGFVASVDFLKPDIVLQFVKGNEGERSLRDEGSSRIRWRGGVLCLHTGEKCLDQEEYGRNFQGEKEGTSEGFHTICD